MNATQLSTRDVYDVAQLAGGLPRVVDTAVVALLGRGRLTVDGAGRLSAVGTAVHPVEAAVLELAGPRPRRSIASLRLRAQDDPRLTSVADRLTATGLLRRNPLAGFSRSWPAHRSTAAGRRVLADWRTAPPIDRAGVDVALDGPQRMTDQLLYQAVFGPEAVPVGRRPGRRSGAGPGHSVWAYGGWGGDGGGFGGDGGGCGGGDGGGGGGC